MEGVTVVTHPLVQHKLALIRDKARSTKSFRELLKEIGMLLCYEVTRDLPLTPVEIETPLVRTTQRKIAGKKLVFAPVLRAGMTFVEGMLDLVPDRPRRPHRHVPRARDLRRRGVFLQGAGRPGRPPRHRRRPGDRHRQHAVAAIDRLKERGAKDIRLVCLLGAPEGLERLRACIPTWLSGRRPSTASARQPGLHSARDSAIAGDRAYGTR
jgi:uracil phosphoribosyltransferase